MSKQKLTRAAIMAQRPNIPREDAERIFAEVTGPNGWLEAKGVNSKGQVMYGFRTGIDVDALGRYLQGEVEAAEREAP